MSEVPMAEPSAAEKLLVQNYFEGFDFTKLDTSLEAMLKAGVHFGHVKSRRHPLMDEYIFTTRKNINILDLSQTKERLTTAEEFIQSVVRAGKPVLFVGMKKQTHDVVESLARRLGQHFVTDRWLGGTLTNFKQIRSRAKYLKETQEKMARYKKPFDSEKTNKLYDLKISNRKTWSEVDRRLEKIERYVDKGLIKIHNKEFILK